MLQEYAQSKNGKCLSDQYTNQSAKYTWQCNYGHIWEASWDSIKQSKNFCPKCIKRKTKYSILNLQSYALQNKGKCISDTYINTTHKYTWQCKLGHIWKASWGSIINQNTWCPQCAGNLVYDIENLKEYAQSKNGLCISKLYTNAHTRYTWQCQHGHVWKASWHSVNTKHHWCPKCNKEIRESKGEKRCREVFEKLTNKKFPTKRPLFLKNPDTGYPLELDGYCEELKLAFEYDGEQHYKSIDCFGGKDKWIKIQELDNLKDDLCKIADVNLIRIPYTVKQNNIEEYIKNELKNENIRY